MPGPARSARLSTIMVAPGIWYTTARWFAGGVRLTPVGVPPLKRTVLSPRSPLQVPYARLMVARAVRASYGYFTRVDAPQADIPGFIRRPAENTGFTGYRADGLTVRAGLSFACCAGRRATLESHER